MRFEYLSQVRALAPSLAAAQSAAFAHQLPDWSEADALAELDTHTGSRCIPTTLLAMEGDDWIGTVSLLANDHDRIRDYAPWLATLVVRESARNRGVGAALVRRCVEDAAAIGVTTLYLYCTSDLVGYYEALGWRQVAHVSILAVADDAGVFVMAIDTAADSLLPSGEGQTSHPPFPFSPREKVPQADEGRVSHAAKTSAAEPSSDLSSPTSDVPQRPSRSPEKNEAEHPA